MDKDTLICYASSRLRLYLIGKLVFLDELWESWPHEEVVLIKELGPTINGKWINCSSLEKAPLYGKLKCRVPSIIGSVTQETLRIMVENDENTEGNNLESSSTNSRKKLWYTEIFKKNLVFKTKTILFHNATFSSFLPQTGHEVGHKENLGLSWLHYPTWPSL